MPFLRRNCKAVVCGEIAYLIGGYGRYRTNRGNTMFFYNCVNGEHNIYYKGRLSLEHYSLMSSLL